MTQISKDDQEWLDKLAKEETVWYKAVTGKKVVLVYYKHWIVSVKLEQYRDVLVNYTEKDMKNLDFWTHMFVIPDYSIRYSRKYYNTIHSKLIVI